MVESDRWMIEGVSDAIEAYRLNLESNRWWRAMLVGSFGLEVSPKPDLSEVLLKIGEFVRAIPSRTGKFGS
jgi:hypothetical protein